MVVQRAIAASETLVWRRDGGTLHQWRATGGAVVWKLGPFLAGVMTAEIYQWFGNSISKVLPRRRRGRSHAAELQCGETLQLWVGQLFGSGTEVPRRLKPAPIKYTGRVASLTPHAIFRLLRRAVVAVRRWLFQHRQSGGLFRDVLSLFPVPASAATIFVARPGAELVSRMPRRRFPRSCRPDLKSPWCSSSRWPASIPERADPRGSGLDMGSIRGHQYLADGFTPLTACCATAAS